MALGEMGIVGLQSIVVTDNDEVAVRTVVFRKAHHPVESGVDGFARGHGKVEAVVETAAAGSKMGRGTGILGRRKDEELATRSIGKLYIDGLHVGDVHLKGMHQSRVTGHEDIVLALGAGIVVLGKGVARSDNAHALLVGFLFLTTRRFTHDRIHHLIFRPFVLRDFLIIERLLVSILALDIVGHIDRVVVHLFLGFPHTVGLRAHAGIFVVWVAGFYEFIMFNLASLCIGIHTGLVFVLFGIRTILSVG